MQAADVLKKRYQKSFNWHNKEFAGAILIEIQCFLADFIENFLKSQFSKIKNLKFRFFSSKFI